MSNPVVSFEAGAFKSFYYSGSSLASQTASEMFCSCSASVLFISDQNRQGFCVWFHPQQYPPLFNTSLCAFAILYYCWHPLWLFTSCWWFFSYCTRGWIFTEAQSYALRALRCLFLCPVTPSFSEFVALHCKTNLCPVDFYFSLNKGTVHLLTITCCSVWGKK